MSEISLVQSLKIPSLGDMKQTILNESEDEDDFALFKSRKALKKQIVCSDDEDEAPQLTQNVYNLESDSDDDKRSNNINNSKSFKPKRCIMEDSDDDNNLLSDNDNTKVFKSKRAIMEDSGDESETDNKREFKSKRAIMEDSDSDEDNMQIFKKKNNIETNMDSDDNQSKLSQVKKPYSYNKDIYDTQSTDDDGEGRNQSNDSDSAPQYPIHHKPANKKKKKSYKENQQELQEIHSETQRMVRESVVSLPYHRPKQRSFLEFLQRKKENCSSSQSTNLKQSMKNTETLIALVEKKKEVEDFYKSESDSEDQDLEWLPTQSNASPTESNQQTPVEQPVSDDGFKFAMQNDNNLNIETDISSENMLNIINDKNTIDLPDLEEIQNNEQDSSNVPNLKISSNDNNSLNEDINEIENNDNESNEKLSLVNPESSMAVETINEDDPNSIKIESELNTPIKISDAEEETPIEFDGTPEPELNKRLTKLGLLKLDLSKLSKSAPRLRCTSSVIDLDDIPNTFSTPQSKPAYFELMNRFIKHSVHKKDSKNKKMDVNVVSKETVDGKEDLVKSTLTVTLDEEESVDKKCDVPGSKLLNLKSKLRSTMIKKREDERIKRFQQKKFMESEEVSEFPIDEPALIDEDELTDGSDTEVETESEPEENDILLVDKKRKKNKFLSEEAEEDDEISNASDNDQLSVDENSQDMNLRYDGSGSDDDTNELPNLDKTTENNTGSKMCENDMSLQSADSFIGSMIPGHQPGGGIRNREASPAKSLNESLHKDNSFISPTNTANDSFFEPNKGNTILFSPTSLMTQKPVEQMNEKTAKMKLDFSDFQSTQDNAEELLDLCSGKFAAKANVNESSSQDLNELAELCSGKFDSNKDKQISNLLNVNDDENSEDEQELLGLCTGKFSSQVNRNKIIDDDEDSNSEINPTLTNKTSNIPPINEDTNSHLGVISDEENILENEYKIKKKRRKRIMVDSDDEAQGSVSELESDDEEEPTDVQKFIGFKDKKRGGIRADFFENEAELSGSDIGSEDEEEANADNDIMDEEEGDLEHYDEEQLRDQVGKAHLKTAMDEDKRQIRLIQEMLLEDGDLHGQGRQRKFRWKNLDQNDDENEQRNIEEEDEEHEEENKDAEWRKQKIEREKFLSEKKDEIIEDEAFIIPDKNFKQNTSVIMPPKEPLKCQDNNQLNNSYDLFNSKVNYRGSFLSRDSQSLSKFSDTYKEKKNNSNVSGGASQKGNFVFQQISAEEAQAKSTSIKRTISHSPVKSKKSRLDRSFFSMDETKKSSSIFKHL